MIGRRLGDYQVLARIGRGGMGSVYLASDPEGLRVALKVLEVRGDHPEALPEGLKRFAAELDVLRRVDHPRLVRALGPVQYAADHHFFPMEFIRGRNLAQVLEAVGRLEATEALGIVSEALDGLEAAHAEGVLHRDVKSANLLIEQDGHVKVCDFGLARALDQTRLTLSGQVLGTPAYVSPEQARGDASGVQSDLYSLGVVLYEALTGSLPFNAESPLALLRQHLDDDPEPPSARREDLPADMVEGIDALVLRALDKDPSKRFESAADMRLATRALLKERATDSTRLETAVRQLVQAETQALERQVIEHQTPKGNRALVLAGAVVVVCGLAFWASGGATPPQPMPRAGASPAPTPEPASPALTATVVLQSGEELSGELLNIEAGRLTLRSKDGTERSVPRDSVREVRYGR